MSTNNILELESGAAVSARVEKQSFNEISMENDSGSKRFRLKKSVSSDGILRGKSPLVHEETLHRTSPPMQSCAADEDFSESITEADLPELVPVNLNSNGKVLFSSRTSCVVKRE